MGEEVNHHSLKAWFENEHIHFNKYEMAKELILQSKRKGLTATEMARITGWSEHRSCASALSTVLRKHHDFVHIKQKGKTHGRYFWRPYA